LCAKTEAHRPKGPLCAKTEAHRPKGPLCAKTEAHRPKGPLCPETDDQPPQFEFTVHTPAALSAGGLLAAAGRGYAGMLIEFVLFPGFAERMPARRDLAQLGYDAV
jgi:hypothetical protein